MGLLILKMIWYLQLDIKRKGRDLSLLRTNIMIIKRLDKLEVMPLNLFHFLFFLSFQQVS